MPRRYLLSDSKSFDTLFFPEKKQLLKLVDDSRLQFISFEDT